MFLLKTDRSYLLEADYTQHGVLIDACLQDVWGCLEHEPYLSSGKSRSRRDVGFFALPGVHGYANHTTHVASEHIIALINLVNEEFNTQYNGVLVNRYNDGTKYISSHSDQEADPSGVVAISVGASRIFRIRDKVTNKIVLDVPTKNFQVLVMGGKFQEEFVHEIPKQLKVFTPRVSFTFRRYTGVSKY